jgi:hypothetical protein
MSFITKLNAVVEDLKNDPNIYVAHYDVLPADFQAITAVEQKLGYKLDSSITDFYKECGGVHLLWINKENSRFDDIKKQIDSFEKPLDKFTYFGENIVPDGSIMILPIETAFLKPLEIEGLVDEDYFSDYEIFPDWEILKVQPFDMYGHSVDVAFILNNTANPPILLGSDYQACYIDSFVIYFKDYLELLLKVKGARSRRNFMEGKFLEEDVHKIQNMTITLSDIEKIDAQLYVNKIL